MVLFVVLGNFSVLFCSLFKVGEGGSSVFGKTFSINAAHHETLVHGDLIVHGAFLPKKMLVDAPESYHVPFLLMSFMWSDDHLISHGFM